MTPQATAPGVALPTAALTAVLGTSSAARAAAARALGSAGLAVQQRLQLAMPTANATRDVASGTVTVAAPPPDMGQMAIVTDPQTGVVSWQFGETRTVAAPGAGGRGEAGTQTVRVYAVPAAAATAPSHDPSGPAPAGGDDGALASRSVLTDAARKLVEVVVFPLVEDGVGAVSPIFAERWEAKHRPYRLRSFTPDDYARPDAALVDGATLAAGRALLMVHGTFSRAHSAFGALPRAVVERLHARYGGRVFAFDHYTLAHDPARNVQWLLSQLPNGSTVDVDIVCHSRGGLVSRVLAERHGDRARVGKVVFVGAPNAGTALVDGSHVTKLLDAYTNVLAVVPPNGVTDLLEGVLTVAKLLATIGAGAMQGLPGLQSMRPGGDFLARTLNAVTGTTAGAAPDDPSNAAEYFAMSSNFDPRPDTPGLNALFRNWTADKVFGADNDLVVPTDGVFAANGSARFPIAATRVFRGADAVAHTEFFARPAAHEQLLTWLGA